MYKFNVNDKIIIYPTPSGWDKINELISDKYVIPLDEAKQWVEHRKTQDGGYQEQLWVIISDLHSMFFNGQAYLETTEITIMNDKPSTLPADDYQYELKAVISNDLKTDKGYESTYLGTRKLLPVKHIIAQSLHSFYDLISRFNLTEFDEIHLTKKHHITNQTPDQLRKDGPQQL